MSTSYASAMKAEAERLARAQQRNVDRARTLDNDVEDAKEDAWASVFAASSSAGAESAEDARRRKLARKAEKRKEKAAAAEANAGNLTVYVTGIPKEVAWTAVQNLFARAGEVRRVKLYRDARGEPKGDGLVTFAAESGLRAALARDDWALFGEPLGVTTATFDGSRGVPATDWARVVILTSVFDVEAVGASGDARGFLARTEELVWIECLRFGAVERVQAFPADPECAVAVRFAAAAAAAACVSAMEGREGQSASNRTLRA